MGDDRVQLLTLEQATSTDIAVIQAMQSRRLNELMVREWAQHAIPIPNGAEGSVTPWSGLDTPSAIVTGLNVFYASPTECYVSVGSLTQFNTTWITNSDPATAARTGFLRAIATLAYPATSGIVDYSTEAWHLLCARIVEVVTSATNVQVFDVPTQQFTTVATNKRIELQIEFKWVSGAVIDGTTMALPGLDAGGSGWEPIAYVSAVSGGSATTNSCRILDVARRIGGVVTTFESNGSVNGAMRVGSVMSQRITSATSPDSGGVPGPISGIAHGIQGNERTLFCSSPDHQRILQVDAADGNSAPIGAGTLVHYYLCPMISATRTRWPLQCRTSTTNTQVTGTKRGLLVGTTVQPNRLRSNSSAIVLQEVAGLAGKYANFSAIPEGAAQYLCSAHRDTGGIYLYPFVMGAGGIHTYATGEKGSGGETCPVLLSIPSASGLSSLNRAWELDLNGRVPNIATVVHLLITLAGDQFEMHNFEVRNYVDDIANQTSVAEAVAAHANSGELLTFGETVNTVAAWVDSTQSTLVLRVPVGWTPSQGHNDATSGTGYHLRMILREFSGKTGSGLSAGAGQVRLIGWEI